MPIEENKPKRSPIPSHNLEHLRYQCKKLDDDLRWLLALLIDSGLRLGEATGLAIDDIVQNHEIPHIKVRPHPWTKLKTIGSERDVPLVRISLWAAKKIKEQGIYRRFAFPRYTDSEYCNANSASAALNKWLKPFIPKNCVIHSLRHSFRDRLREVECPFDIIDRLGGWLTAGVGHTYGKGYPLVVLNRWMSKI